MEVIVGKCNPPTPAISFRHMSSPLSTPAIEQVTAELLKRLEEDIAEWKQLKSARQE